MSDLITKCGYCNINFNIKVKRYNDRKKRGQSVFYCSKICRDKYRFSIINEQQECFECKKSFLRRKNLKRKRKFCSQKCSNTYCQRFIDPEVISLSLRKFYSSEEGKKLLTKVSLKKRKTKICEVCNNSFYGRKRYCSLSCTQKRRSEKISETRKKMFKEGALNVTGGTTKWLIYNNIKVQGSYEYRACIILDQLKRLNLIKDWKKSNFRIKYIGEDNKEHSYLLDFEIINKSGKILYLETKGYVKNKDILKWKAMKDSKLKLIVWMNKHLKQIERKIKI